MKPQRSQCRFAVCEATDVKRQDESMEQNGGRVMRERERERLREREKKKGTERGSRDE